MAQSPVIPDVHPEAGGADDFRRHMGKVSRHSAVFFAGTIFNAVSAYGFKVYLARALGAHALGIYALGMTIVAFTGMFNGLGLPQTALRFVAAYSATGKWDLLRGFLARSVAILLGANLLLVGAMLVGGPWVAERFYHAPELKAYMGWFAVIMLLGVFSGFLGNVLGGYKDVARRTVISNFIGNPVMMAATIILVASGLGLRGYLSGQVASAVCVVVLMLAAVWKLTPAQARAFGGDLPGLDKEAISFSKAAMGMAFLGFFIAQTDRIVIGHYLPARDLGIYATAAAVVAFVPVILKSVNQIFAPTISDLHARGQIETLARMFQTLTKWILGLSLPLVAVIVVFSAPIMRIFGTEFERGWPILVIGAAGQLVNCGVGSSGMLVFMSGHPRLLVRIQSVVAGVAAVLSLTLVPVWGIAGAALAAAVTNVAANVAYLAAARQTLGISPYNRSYWRLALPMAGMLVSLMGYRALLAQHAGSAWILVGAALVLAYGVFIGTALLFGLDADDRLVVNAAWSRIRPIPNTGKEG